MAERTAWIWGRHPVVEALRQGIARQILLASGRKDSPVLDEIRALAHQGRVLVREVPRAEVERIAPGQNTQGVAAQVVERPLSTVRDLLARVEASAQAPFLLALDQIQDPHNLGALLRTANAAGVQGVIVPQRRSAPITGIVAKTSAGAVSYVPILEVTNLARALEEVRKAGIWTVGLEGTAGTLIYAVDLRVRVALVVGGEASGLRRLTREHCDFLARLPMAGQVESLNASVAGSIAMYEVVRQRLNPDFAP